MNEEKNDNKDDEQPDDDGQDDVPLSPDVQAQFRAVSETIARSMLPLQRILKDIVIVQQAPLREAMRVISEAQSAKLAESFQAVGRIYSAPLNDMMKSLAEAQTRPFADYISKSLSGLSLAPKISETLGKQFALQFPKIDFGGYRKVLGSSAFFDAKKLLDSFSVTLPTIDPAVFEGITTRARIDLDEATVWIEPDEEAAEPSQGIEAALDEFVAAIKDERRSSAKLQIVLFVLGTIIMVLLSLAEAKFERPVIVRPVIVIEDKMPDVPTVPPSVPPASPSPKDPPPAAP